MGNGTPPPIAGNDYFKLSTTGSGSPGDSYSVDTMEVLYQQYDKSTAILFSCGQTRFRHFPTGRHRGGLCGFVVWLSSDRRQTPPLDMKVLEQAVPASRSDWCNYTCPGLVLALLRSGACVSQGLSIRYLVPPPWRNISNYIRLYQ